MTTPAPEALLPPLPELYAGKRVLLTGATGFLGKVFLSSLLKGCPDVGKLIVLLRADSPQGAQDRFLRDVIASPALDPLREEHGMGLREFVLARVEVLAADLSEPDAGLTAEQLDHVTRDLDLVMHIAGLVDFVPPLDEAVSVNVDGTLQALALAQRAGPGRCHFVHISTCFVCGLRPGQHAEELDVRDYPAREDVRFQGFDAEQELVVARRLIERIRGEELTDPAVQADLWEEAEGSPRKAKRLGEVRTKRRLIEAGVERARRWGWPNTYTYTKALAERLVETRLGTVASGVLVRPAVVESSLGYPFPGWNQGINTSAPLVWLTSQGQRYWPTHRDFFLDVIPVDSVVHALVAIGGAAMAGAADPVYQLGTSDVNPFAMRRVVEIASLAYREHDNSRVSMVRSFMRRHFEGIDVSPETYKRLGIPIKVAAARRLGAWLEKVPLPDERPRLAAFLDKVKQTVKTTTRELERAQQVVDIFMPFIAECPVTFRTDCTRRLMDRLQPADRERFPYAPPTLDWRHYWKDVHIPGLERWAFPQLRLAQGASPTEFEREFKTLTALFEDRARFGKLPLWRRLDGKGEVAQRLTYEEGLSRAQAGGRRLIRDGVRPGERVVLWSENAPEWGLCYFAVLFAGGTVVPLEPDTEPARVLALASAAGANLILASPECRKKGGAELQQRIAEAGSSVRMVELEALVAARGKQESLPALPQEQELAPRAPASLIYTSGTTGAPKGVLLSHQAFCEQVRALASLYAVGSEDRILSVLPLHHCFEFSAGFLLPLYGGASVTYLDETSAEAVRRGLDAVRPTAMIGVPALFDAWYRRIRRQVKARGSNAERSYEALLAFHRELRARTGWNLGARLFGEVHQGFGGALRFLVSGGAALPREIALEFQGLGIELYEGYGLTEAAPVICAHRPSEERSPGSVGAPIPGVEVRIREPDGEGVGEILARSPSLFLGYDRDPELTARTLVDGWLHTGDLGRLDERGQVHVVGRIKDAIVDAAGNTVHPDEVEDLYQGCEDVAELAVAGVAGKGDQHDVVAALIVPKSDGEGGIEGARERIREFVRVRSESLPWPKRIKALQFTTRALPRTPTRKVKRAEVARLLAEVRSDRPGASRRARRAAAGAGLSRVAQLFEEVAGVEAARVVPEATLSQELGLDSIALAEVALALGEELGRPAPRNLAGVVTVADLLRLFDADTAEREAPRVQQAEPRAIPLPAPVRRGVSQFLDGLSKVGYGRVLQCSVVGRGNIPHHTNVIVVANHQSHLDVGLVKHALGQYGRDLVSAGARDYFFSSTFKATYFENFTQVVPFDRAASVRESLERFVELLRQGRSVLIFPEGTRSVTGRMASFKPGLGLVVQAARVGILPIYLHGTHQSMPKGSWLPRREPLEARIGPYLPPERLLGATAHLGRRQQANAIVAAVRGAMVALRDKSHFDLEAELRRGAGGEDDPVPPGHAGLDLRPGDSGRGLRAENSGRGLRPGDSELAGAVSPAEGPGQVGNGSEPAEPASGAGEDEAGPGARSARRARKRDEPSSPRPTRRRRAAPASGEAEEE